MTTKPDASDERSYGKTPGKDPQGGLAHDTGPAQPERIERVKQVQPSLKETKPADETEPGAKQSAENICPTCDGSGVVDGKPCRDCNGTGTITSIVGDA